MSTRTINGLVGQSRLIDCEIIIYDTYRGKSWYVQSGGVQVNLTDTDSLVEGVHIDTLFDYDTMNNDDYIQTEEQLEKFIEE